MTRERQERERERERENHMRRRLDDVSDREDETNTQLAGCGGRSLGLSATYYRSTGASPTRERCTCRL
jgi:hypothetical protein